MRGPAFLLALAALVGAVDLSAAQNGEPASNEQTPILVPGNQRAPAAEEVPLDAQPPAPEEGSVAEQAPMDQAPTGDDPAPINPNPLSGLTLDSLAATRTAPLFTPSRTAPAVDASVGEETIARPVETPPPTEEPLPQLELIGIVLTDNSQTALLRDPSTNEVHRLSSGEQFENWELKIVDARSVEFHQGDRVQDLKMFDVFPISAVPGESSGEGLPPEFNGQIRPQGRRGQNPDETQNLEGEQNPDSPQSSDIVQGAEDVQSSDIVRVPNATEDPNGAADPDASANSNQPGDPNAPPPPPPDFAPPIGDAPIPDEGAPPPDVNSN